MNRMQLTHEEALALAKMEAEAPFVGAGKHLSKAGQLQLKSAETESKKSDVVRPKVASAA